MLFVKEAHQLLQTLAGTVFSREKILKIIDYPEIFGYNVSTGCMQHHIAFCSHQARFQEDVNICTVHRMQSKVKKRYKNEIKQRLCSTVH